uniref:Integrase catalytic domain-containing protein n=1 Tax=Erpetoichthys calabaricus TaxID=27687 RepID=A0A8C4S126_ERPCA
SWTSRGFYVCHHVKKCITCQQLKNPPGKPAGLLQSTIADGPGETLGVDLMGPFPVTSSRKTVLMVVIDYFSKWVELFALTDAKTNKICSTLKNEIFTRWGVPKNIISDRGPQFTSSLLDELYTAWGVKKNLTTAYHPQANMTERVNRTLKNMIASYVGERHQDWDKWLPELRFALNTAVHEATGETPALVALGRQLKGPLDRLLPRAPNPETTTYNNIFKIEELRRRIQQRLVSSTSRHAKLYNARRKEAHFQPGDLVWIRAHHLSDASKRFSAKLAPKWLGPAKIISQTGPVNFQFQRGIGTDSKIDTIHVANLKPYFGPPLSKVGGGGGECSGAT